MGNILGDYSIYGNLNHAGYGDRWAVGADKPGNSGLL